MTEKAEGTCVIDGCDKPKYARGWCGTHYHRWARKGDPEWKRGKTRRKANQSYGNASAISMCNFCQSTDINEETRTCNKCGTTAPQFG